MIGIGVSDEARAAFLGWSIGLLELEGLLPRAKSPAFVSEVERIEAGIKERYGGMSRKELAACEAARGYAEHFAAAGKAYPVLLQVGAIASKGRRLTMPDCLVQAMFAAELESMLLTAGHDLAALSGPVTLGLASGSESMPTLGGAEKEPPAGDLVMRDSVGIFASALLGPDSRSSIGPGTERLLFVVYAPPEVSTARLDAHLDELASLATSACPGLRSGGAETMRL